MSREIDEKVVEMRFDNSQFEKNVQTSISSLEKLKDSLDLDGAARGLDEVSSSMDNTSGFASSLTAGIETIGHKFSAMEVVAITALANITNSVVNLGKQMISSLTIDQIMSGFSKYENKTTAVQTIVNATGKSIDEVNAQLEKLNWFTDETSYNFTDMVSNIGKFTSMGIDLETAVTAMMGIANWAAISGQGVNEASRAMYNLAQSIGVGAVKLQDWKSIENANMATKEFKEIVIETAKSLGILDEEGRTAAGTLIESSNFSSTLSEGWFTSDVLLAALEKYGGYAEEVYRVATEEGLTAAEAMERLGDSATGLGERAFKAAQEAKTFTDAINATKDAVSTGWLNTFEIIFGNYEEAKVLWTNLANEMYDIFASGAEGRNELLSEWKEIGGRTKLVEGFYNVLTILKDAITTVKEAFRDIFPAKTAEQLYGITEAFYNFTERIKNNTRPLENMKRVLKGFFAILDIGKQFIGAIIRAMAPIFGTISTVGGGLFDLTANVGDFLVRIDETIKKTGIFDKVFTKIADVIMIVITAFKRLFQIFKESKVFTSFVTLVDKIRLGITNLITTIKEKFSSPGFELFHSLLERIRTILSQLGGIVSKVVTSIINGFNSVFDSISASSILTVLSAIWSVIVAIAKVIGNLLGKAVSSLAEKIKAGDFQGFLDILKTLSLGGIAVGITKFIKSFTDAFSGVKDILSGISGILDGVRGCFEAYQNKLKADTLMKIASAIAILVASIVVLSLIDEQKIMTAITAIASLFAGLMVSMSLLTSMSGKASKAAKTTTMMIGMSLSVLILASALKKVASLDTSQIVSGMIGIAGLVAVLVIATKAMSKDSKKIIKGAAQLVIFGVAIKILASACKKMAKLSWGEMIQGLVGVGALMAEVALFLNFSKFNKKCFSTAAGMVLLGIAIKTLASACKTFANLSWSDIGKGLASVGALLLELSIFTRLIAPKKMISTGIGMIAIAAAIKILGSAMFSMSSLSWQEIAKGLLSMAGSLAAVTVALNFLPKGMISKGLGLIAVAAALLILSSALNKMGNMSWESVAKGLLTLAGSMTILAVALNFMKGTLSGSAALLVAAAALAILVPVLAFLGSLSLKTIGKSLLYLAGVFLILGIAGLVLSPLVPALLGLSAAIALVGIGALGLGVGLLALSAAFAALAAGGVAMASSIVASLEVIILGIAQLIPTVATILAQGLIEFARVIGEGAPTILESVKTILLGLLALIVEVGPQLIDTIFVLLESVLTTLLEYAPTLIQAVIDILLAILQGIADNIGMVVQTAIDVVIAFIDGVTSKLPDIIQAGFDLLIGFIDGIADAIENNTQRLIDSVSHLIKVILDAAVDVLFGGVDLFLDCGKNLITGLWDGIKGAASKVWDGIKSVGNGIKNWFCNLFGIHSPSTVMAGYGRNLDEGLALGLEEYAGIVQDSTGMVGDTITSGMTDALEKASNIIENGNFSDPTIRPVIDLSEIQNGAGQIGKMMSDIDGYSLSGSYDYAQNASQSASSKPSVEENATLDGLAKTVQKLAQNPANQTNNTFYISGDNPKEIAEEVSRILANQVERRNASWG